MTRIILILILILITSLSYASVPQIFFLGTDAQTVAVALTQDTNVIPLYGFKFVSMWEIDSNIAPDTSYIQYYSQIDYDINCDFNRDGIVNFKDFSIFADNWLKGV